MNLPQISGGVAGDHPSPLDYHYDIVWAVSFLLAIVADLATGT